MESAVGCDEGLIEACAALAQRMDSQLPSGIKSSAIEQAPGRLAVGFSARSAYRLMLFHHLL